MSQAGKITSSVLPPGQVIETIQGNTGGPVGPDGTSNIHVIGDGVGITISGNPGTNTLTASLVGDITTDFDTDSGTAVPSAGIIEIIADTAIQHSGSSVSFSGFGNTVRLNVTDEDDNTIIGNDSGNATLTGEGNTVLGAATAPLLSTGFSNTIMGQSTASVLTQGSNNTIIGQTTATSLSTGGANIIIGESAAINLTSGGNNTIIGNDSAAAYVGGESSNIIIGRLTSGVASDAHCLRIGQVTGNTNPGDINKAFIQGIRGITPDTADGIPVYIGSDGQLGTVGTGGGGVSSVDGDNGTATPAGGVLRIVAGLGTLNCGSTVSFDGSTDTLALNVTDVNANTIIGRDNGNASIAGGHNQIFGSLCGTVITSASDNIILGYNTANSLDSGSQNVIIGNSAGNSLVDGNLNTYVGYAAGNSMPSGNDNTFIGAAAGTSLSSGSSNTIVGGEAGLSFTSGSGNTIMGTQAAASLGSSSSNTIIGAQAGNALNGVSGNVIIGNEAGISFTSGENNVLIGNQAGIDFTTTESNNILINADGDAGLQNTLVIGDGTGTGVQLLNQAFIHGIRGITPAGGDGIPVYIDSLGQLGTVGSGGGGVTSIDGDNGTATPSGGVLNIVAGLFTQNSGASVSFSGSSDTLQLNMTDGNNNTIIGLGSGNGTVSGSQNVVLGHQAAGLLGSGSGNVIIGETAGYSIGGASNNVIIGKNTASALSSGTANTILGISAGSQLTTGSTNTLIGASAGSLLGTASSNTMLGHAAGSSLGDANNNIIIGRLAGTSYTSVESNNILIGSLGVVLDDNTLRLGAATGSGTAELNRSFIHGIRGIVPTNANGLPVYIDSIGQLGTVGVSSASYTAISTTPYVSTSTDSFISVNTSSIAITVQLPNAATSGRIYTIKDRTGNASANNITITTVGGAVNIDGATTLVMNTAYASVNIMGNGTSYEIF